MRAMLKLISTIAEDDEQHLHQMRRCYRADSMMQHLPAIYIPIRFFVIAGIVLALDR